MTVSSMTFAQQERQAKKTGSDEKYSVTKKTRKLLVKANTKAILTWPQKYMKGNPEGVSRREAKKIAKERVDAHCEVMTKQEEKQRKEQLYIEMVKWNNTLSEECKLSDKDIKRIVKDADVSIIPPSWSALAKSILFGPVHESYPRFCPLSY